MKYFTLQLHKTIYRSAEESLPFYATIVSFIVLLKCTLCKARIFAPFVYTGLIIFRELK